MQLCSWCCPPLNVVIFSSSLKWELWNLAFQGYGCLKKCNKSCWAVSLSPCCQDAASLAKSSSFEQSILNKKRRKKEQEERARFERERENEQRQREKEEKLRQERERQQQKLKKLGSNDSISIGCEFRGWVLRPPPLFFVFASASCQAPPP